MRSRMYYFGAKLNGGNYFKALFKVHISSAAECNVFASRLLAVVN